MGSRLSHSAAFYHRVDTPADRRLQGQFSQRLGGLGLLDHAFGPLVYNSDFSILGPLAAGEFDSSLFSYSGADNSTTVGAVEEAHYLAANEFCYGIQLNVKDWDLGGVTPYSLSGTGYTDPTNSYSGRFLADDTSKYSSGDPQRWLLGFNGGDSWFYHNVGTLVSGVELVFDQTTSNTNSNKFIAVYNQPTSKYCWEHGHSVEGGSISLITPIAANAPYSTLQGIRFPLNKGKDRVLDSQFKYFPKGWSDGPDSFANSNDLASSSLAGWELFDVSSYPTRDNRTGVDKPFGYAAVSALSGSVVEWSQGYVPSDNDKYAIAATVAQEGSWLGASGVCIRANRNENVVGYSQKHQIITRNQLIPNQPYKLSVTAKSDNADCSGYRVLIINVTHGSAHYSPSGGGTWVDGNGGALAVADRINFPAPQHTTTDQNGWTTCSITFTPSGEFGVDDDYKIIDQNFKPTQFKPLWSVLARLERVSA